MDVAPSLIQAYLHLNGYFTATDCPLVEIKQGRAQVNKCGMTLHTTGPAPESCHGSGPSGMPANGRRVLLSMTASPIDDQEKLS